MQERISTYGLVAVALIASLVGGSVGAYVSTKMAQPDTAAATPAPTPTAPVTALPTPAPTLQQPLAATDHEILPVEPEAPVATAPAPAPTRVAYAPARSRGSVKKSPRRVYYTSAAQSGAPSRTYYEYKKPSFWSRHRDVMTIAIGTGVGTAVGAIAGGGKGAAIGALAGGGGTGVYTLMRKRSNGSR
jgi:hypothetical protein